MVNISWDNIYFVKFFLLLDKVEYSIKLPGRLQFSIFQLE